MDDLPNDLESIQERIALNAYLVRVARRMLRDAPTDSPEECVIESAIAHLGAEATRLTEARMRLEGPRPGYED